MINRILSRRWTYGVQQQVQPINYAIGPGTEAEGSVAKGAMSIAGSLAGFAGPRVASSGALSGLFSGGGSTGNVGDYGAAAGDYSGIAGFNPDDYALGASMAPYTGYGV